MPIDEEINARHTQMGQCGNPIINFPILILIESLKWKYHFFSLIISKI